jgi:hypothetical protein
MITNVRPAYFLTHYHCIRYAVKKIMKICYCCQCVKEFLLDDSALSMFWCPISLLYSKLKLSRSSAIFRKLSYIGLRKLANCTARR